MLSGEESLAEFAPRAHLPNSSIGSFSLQQAWKRAAAMENFSSLFCCRSSHIIVCHISNICLFLI